MSLESRPVKSKNGGIGGSCTKNTSKPMKRSFLRPVSPKQAKRTAGLQEKLEVMLNLQMELYGTTRCELGFAGFSKCLPDSPLVFDHVRGRNQNNADRYENGQVACWHCNGIKGSKKWDGRSEKMVKRLIELDKE